MKLFHIINSETHIIKKYNLFIITIHSYSQTLIENFFGKKQANR